MSSVSIYHIFCVDSTTPRSLWDVLNAHSLDCLLAGKESRENVLSMENITSLCVCKVVWKELLSQRMWLNNFSSPLSTDNCSIQSVRVIVEPRREWCDFNVAGCEIDNWNDIKSIFFIAKHCVNKIKKPWSSFEYLFSSWKIRAFYCHISNPLRWSIRTAIAFVRIWPGGVPLLH